MDSLLLALGKVKEWGSSAWEGFTTIFTTVSSRVIVILAALLGLMVYYLSLKNREIEELKAQISLVGTQKQSDLLEATIQQKLNDSNLLDKQISEYNKLLNALEDKRNSLPEGTDHDPADQTKYWNTPGN